MRSWFISMSHPLPRLPLNLNKSTPSPLYWQSHIFIHNIIVYDITSSTLPAISTPSLPLLGETFFIKEIIAKKFIFPSYSSNLLTFKFNQNNCLIWLLRFLYSILHDLLTNIKSIFNYHFSIFFPPLNFVTLAQNRT